MGIITPEPTRAVRATADDIEAAFYRLLDEFPAAPIASVDSGGMIVPLPDSINVGEHPLFTGRSGLDGVPSEDRPHFIATFDRVLTEGMGECELHPAGYVVITYHGFDLRERHGVLIGVLTAAAETGYEEDRAVSPELTPAHAPRFATIKKDERSTIVEVAGALTEILGWEPEDMVGRRTLEFVHPDDHQLAIDNWVEMLAQSGPGPRIRQRLLHKDGSWVWFEVTNHNFLTDPDQKCVCAAMVDISDEMAAHEALRDREQLLGRLAETVPVGLLQIDADRKVVYTNDRLHEILGVGRADTADAQLASIIEDDRPTLERALRDVLDDGADSDLELAIERGRGDALHFCRVSLRALRHEDRTVSGAIACVADTTESTRMRRELTYRATFDDLTGCQNRASIMAALAADVQRDRRRSERAVMFIDLDGFKAVNDSYGHAAGDRLLQSVSRILRESFREGDLVGRTGGDEFLVICPEVGGAEGALRLARRLSQSLRAGLKAAEGEPTCRVSIGVAWSQGARRSADTLVALADEAMYASKRAADGEPRLVRRRSRMPRPPRSAHGSEDGSPSADSPSAAA
jgi:diguanylate cyclase (GGDEF)-like protein/PAS domain S-box-containing protein